jgi:hypothetical protein
MSQRPIDVVTDFYTALAESDADVIAKTTDNYFAQDVAIEWPHGT